MEGIYFSGRKLLAEQLEAWCAKHGAAQCALNYVTALDSLGGLDVDKCSEIITAARKAVKPWA